jgi:hypothetical protein
LRGLIYVLESTVHVKPPNSGGDRGTTEVRREGHQVGYTVYGIRYVVYGIWYMVQYMDDIREMGIDLVMIYGIWSAIYGISTYKRHLQQRPLL